MPWQNTPAKRQRDAEVYGPEYRASRKIALRRAGGRCERCGRRGWPLQADHATPVAQGGSHHPDNLMVLCSGPGSCHAAKTARDSHAARRKGGGNGDPDHVPRTQWQ